jgi:squalene monooxygenase
VGFDGDVKIGWGYIHARMLVKGTHRGLLLQVFCDTGDSAHEEMRQACFDYLQLGGWYSAGPVSLLSGLNPRPSVLVLHFFAVAVFGVGRLLLPRPTLRYF